MKANLMNKTIELTKKEAKAAGILNSDAYKDLQTYRNAYPNFELDIIATPKRKNQDKGLTYEYMEKYIREHGNTHLEEFQEMIKKTTLKKTNMMVEREKIKATPYLEVKKWFYETFTDFEKARKEHEERINKILKKAS